MFLIGRQNENLTNPFSLFDGSNFEDVLGQNAHKYMSASMLFEDNIILPLFGFFVDKTNAVDIEEKQYLKSHFVGDKLAIVSLVFMNLKFFTIPFVLVKFCTLRNLEIFFLLLTLKKVIFFVEEHSPSIVVIEIFAVLFSKNISQIFDVLAG